MDEITQQKKIVVFDCTRFKFSRVLMEHWERMGHIVKYSMYFDPVMVHWADICFFDWVDNSLIRASNPDDEFWKTNPQPRFGEKKIVTRCHDIDAWTGHYHQVNWSWVNDLIFIGDHIQKLVTENISIPENVKIHKVKHGIDTNKFVFRNREKNNKIAWVGRIVGHKCIELALQVLAENPEYELHAVGTSLDSWELYYVNDFVKRNNLKFFHYPQVDNINDFLDDKSFILLTSFKEAFSYASAEGMSKGLKPLIHHFYGASSVWDKKYLWEKVSDVKLMLEGDYNPEEYRKYIEDNYPLDKMLENYDKILGLK
jgi:glycosyltransferase involved in cell wall biosynthesis